MKKRIFAISLMMLITLSLFVPMIFLVPISASAETVEINGHTVPDLNDISVLSELIAEYPYVVLIKTDGLSNSTGYRYYLYLMKDKVTTTATEIKIGKCVEFDSNGETWDTEPLYDSSASKAKSGYGMTNTIIFTNHEVLMSDGTVEIAPNDKCDIYHCPMIDNNYDLICDICGGAIETPNNDQSNSGLPLYEFYPDRIDRSISGVEDIIFAYYEDDSIPRPSDGSYLVMFKNNDTVFFASASKPFRKYSGSSSIMLSDQSTFDYWYVEGAKINYLGKTASFTPVEWIAGTHDVLNWSDDSVYQSFENIGTAVFPKTPQTQTQLPKVVGAEMLMGVMKEMIAILPCLIALLMGYLALRKALAILQQILYQA